MQNDTRIAVDVAKAVFELAVSDRPGRVARHERLRRGQFLSFLAQHPAANVIMEGCGSAHYWGRRIEQLGPCCRPTTCVPTSGGTRPAVPTPRAFSKPAATKISARCPSRPWLSRC
jgi:hypothetical protein